MDVQNLPRWRDIEQDFSDTLIIGNGGSMAVCDSFGYKDLYKYGCRKSCITAAVQNIFTELSPEHKDFERVLYKLWQLAKVNGILEIQDEQKKIETTISDVKHALLETVKGVHPSYDAVDKKKLLNIGRFTTHFTNVFSLNYDLTLHWALDASKNEHSLYFSDGFTHVVNRKKNTSLKRGIKQYSFDQKRFNATNINTRILYPHGNLSLYKAKSKTESRLVGQTDGLLAALTRYWNYSGAPLFISEGTSENKVQAIRASKYLSMVFDEYLPREKSNITIIGWGMGKQDTHILEKLKDSKCKKYAVGVYKGKRANKTIEKEITHFTEALEPFINLNMVTFFDSSSAGCWANEANS